MASSSTTLCTTCSRKFSLELNSNHALAFLTFIHSRIPFYHAEEATWAIAPLLGERYIQQKTNFFGDLWTAFTNCKYVEPGTGAQAGGLVWSKNEVPKNKAS